jgi:predicted Zn-dependent protease
MSQSFQVELSEAVDLGEAAPKKALKIFARLIKTYPDSPQPRFERAIVLLNLDRDSEAREDLEEVLRLDPTYPGASDWLARIEAGAGKPLLAAERLLATLIATPAEDWSANGQKWADCAFNFIKAGEPGRALDALAVYFERYEGKQRGYEVYRPAPYRARAKALLDVGRADDALEAINTACADQNSVPADKFMRVQVLAALGRGAEALSEFNALRATYEGTDPFNETLAVLRANGIEPTS